MKAKPNVQPIEWGEPQPLDRDAMKGTAFPMAALPQLIQAAVAEHQKYSQQPKSIVASSALAAVSLATQALGDIARDGWLTSPLSLNFLMVASSGERKTAADRAFSGGIARWEKTQADQLRGDIQRRKAEIAAWDAQREGYESAIKAAVRKKTDDAAKYRQLLIEHAEKKPPPLMAPRLRYEEVNAQSLASALAEGYPSASLWTDEGGIFTGSQGMSDDAMLGFMALLNRLWDGGMVRHDRKQAKSVHLEGRRFTVSLMVQPEVLRDLVQKGGGLTRGSGYLARYLIASPDSTIGNRPYQAPPEGMPALTAFSDRIYQLLERPLQMDEQGRLVLPVLKLSGAAFNLWRDYHDDVESRLGALGDFGTVRDFGAKSAEYAGRIAGCLHLFSGDSSEVTEATMQQGIDLARWYLGESLRVMDLLVEPQVHADARILDRWLHERGTYVAASHVLTHGPSAVRTAERRDAAVELLASLDRARFHREADGSLQITINPRMNQLANAIPAKAANA